MKISARMVVNRDVVTLFVTFPDFVMQVTNWGLCHNYDLVGPNQFSQALCCSKVHRYRCLGQYRRRD